MYIATTSKMPAAATARHFTSRYRAGCFLFSGTSAFFTVRFAACLEFCFGAGVLAGIKTHPHGENLTYYITAPRKNQIQSV
jgi:hypothetical protein